MKLTFVFNNISFEINNGFNKKKIGFIHILNINEFQKFINL